MVHHDARAMYVQGRFAYHPSHSMLTFASQIHLDSAWLMHNVGLDPLAGS